MQAETVVSSLFGKWAKTNKQTSKQADKQKTTQQQPEVLFLHSGLAKALNFWGAQNF